MGVGGIFLSTLSLRRATEQSASYNAYLAISIHALLAESDQSGYLDTRRLDAISIHALLAESDNSAYGALEGASISIHALLAESDDTLANNPPFEKFISIHALLAESDR